MGQIEEAEELVPYANTTRNSGEDDEVTNQQLEEKGDRFIFPDPRNSTRPSIFFSISSRSHPFIPAGS